MGLDGLIAAEIKRLGLTAPRLEFGQLSGNSNQPFEAISGAKARIYYNYIVNCQLAANVNTPYNWTAQLTIAGQNQGGQSNSKVVAVKDVNGLVVANTVWWFQNRHLNVIGSFKGTAIITFTDTSSNLLTKEFSLQYVDIFET